MWGQKKRRLDTLSESDILYKTETYPFMLSLS
jgi:hypothetical protein